MLWVTPYTLVVGNTHGIDALSFVRMVRCVKLRCRPPVVLTLGDRTLGDTHTFCDHNARTDRTCYRAQRARTLGDTHTFSHTHPPTFPSFPATANPYCSAATMGKVRKRTFPAPPERRTVPFGSNLTLNVIAGKRRSSGIERSRRALRRCCRMLRASPGP